MFGSNNQGYFSVVQMKTFLDEQQKKGIEIKNIWYNYGLLSILSEFKITAKGLSGYDALSNYCYFSDSNNIKFWKANIMQYFADGINTNAVSA